MNEQSKRRLRMLLGIFSISITVLLVGRILIGIDDWSRDWSTNHAEIGPIAVDGTPDELTEKICAWIVDKPHWKLISADRDEPTEHELKLTRTTLLLRFTDDVSVTISVKESGVTELEASSKSRLGKGDLGQNPRNLKELLTAIQ